MSYKRENIKILLAESNEEDRKSLVKTLSKYFLNVIEAESGGKALSIFQDDKSIDIIIANSNLLDLEGLEFLNLIRMQNLHIPFIVTTGDINSEKLLKAIDLNVSAFLIKPISTIKLLEKVDIFSEQIILKKSLTSKKNDVENYITAVDKVSVIFKMDYSGKITYMNTIMQEESGYEKEEYENLNFKNLLHPTIPEKYIEEIWEQIKNDKIWKGTNKFITKDKQDFYLNSTIFEINSYLNDNVSEFISIGFLSTKENLEKRDFQKKVILNIKEANEKAYILNQKLKTLGDEYTEIQNQLTLTKDNIQKLELKIKQKENQINEQEKEISQLNQKYNKMLINKREEVEYHINLSQTNKLEVDKMKTELKVAKDKIESLLNKNKKALEENNSKNIIIRDLRDILKSKK